MDSITVNANQNAFSQDFPVSQEVKEAFYEAKKRAAKQGTQAKMPDRYVLWVLLLYNRMFSRLDGVLKHAGSSPRVMRQKLKDQMAQDPEGLSVSPLLERATDYAKADGADKVEIDYLLLALAESSDPVVQTLMHEAGLDTDKLKLAIATARENTTSRLVFYFIKELVEVVVTVLFLVILIKQGIGEFRLIPSESMVPTLQIGDRVVVEKVSHWTRKPHRGDVLVFYPPYPLSILKHDPISLFLRATGFSGLIYKKESGIDIAYIKRVIGLPGDVIDVRPNVGVFINGKMLNEPYIAEVDKETCTFIQYCGPVIVPKGMYYMMGDNRNHSMDSRFWEFLPQERIIGRAVFRFWPLGPRFGPLQHPVYATKDRPAKNP